MSAYQFQTSNKDLEWSLEAINQRKRAVEFVMAFESQLCVYSASVEQFYTNYTINFTGADASTMVILPNPYAFHDTYHGIEGASIRDTGLHIVPGDIIGKSGLFVMVTYKDKKVRPAPIPLKHAIKKMLNSQHGEDPFLPLLIKGDLREFDAQMPCLHLHRVKLSELTLMSDFDKKSIQSAISDKLSDLYKVSDSLTF